MMRRFALAVAAMFLALSSTVAWGAKAPVSRTLKLDPKRTVEVIDVMGGEVFTLAQQVYTLSKDTKEPIYILLNSPGGATMSGYTFIDAINNARAKGTRVICVSGVLAASMAFNVFAHCDERYALAHTKLLFHPVRIVGGDEGLTSKDLRVWAEQLRTFDVKNSRELRAMMGADAAWFARHYWAETLWEAEDLLAATNGTWLKIVDSVEGTDKLFTFRRARSLFGGEDKQKRRLGDYPTKPIMIQGGRYAIRYTTSRKEVR
jgi:ATP-dependent protease ClpP protease subunit